MYWKVFTILSFLILSGCASKNFDMEQMTSGLPGPAVYRDSRTVEEIEALKPQLNFPIKLAVSQPLEKGRWWWLGANWSPEELNVIESWGGPLKEAGFASEIVVLPSPFIAECSNNKDNCKLDQNRKLAAQFRADALLVISAAHEVDAYPNALGILDFTIIGCFIVPAHHVNSLTVLEGALIDNRNEYLYAFQRSHSEVRNISPLAYASENKAAKKSREAALRAFGDKMIGEVKKHSNSKLQ